MFPAFRHVHTYVKVATERLSAVVWRINVVLQLNDKVGESDTIVKKNWVYILKILFSKGKQANYLIIQ